MRHREFLAVRDRYVRATATSAGLKKTSAALRASSDLLIDEVKQLVTEAMDLRAERPVSPDVAVQRDIAPPSIT